MAASTGPVDTAERHGDDYSVPVKANAKVNAGALVVWDGGFAAPGRTATGLSVIGRAQENVDNTGGAAGAKSVLVRRGVFKFQSDPADAVARANVGADGFITDDQTISKTNGGNTRSRAGRIVELDVDGGVWIDTRY